MNDIIVDPNDNNDLVVYQGDFFIGFSDFQHIAHVTEALPGQYKQWPFIGFGIRKYLNGPFDASARRRLQLQLESDGFNVKAISFKDDVLQVKI